MTRRVHASAALLILVLAACGGGGGDEVTDPLNDNDLSQTEREAVAAAISAAATQGTTGAGPASSNLLVLDARSREVSGSYPFHGEHPCEFGGHITWTGNLNYDANETTGWWQMSGGLLLQVGDRTNNLNDCAVAPDVILDGTLNLVIAGTSTEGVGSTLNGQISMNRRGPTGGLVPRGSCWIMVSVMRGATRATGSVCGVSL
jgi:hypothetical protein